jgi:hypothetical protein
MMEFTLLGILVHVPTSRVVVEAIDLEIINHVITIAY